MPARRDRREPLSDQRAVPGSPGRALSAEPPRRQRRRSATPTWRPCGRSRRAQWAWSGCWSRPGSATACRWRSPNATTAAPARSRCAGPHETWVAAQRLRDRGVPVQAVTVWALLGSHDWNRLLTGRRGPLRGRRVRRARAASLGPPAWPPCAGSWRAASRSICPPCAAPGWWRRDIRYEFAARAVGRRGRPRRRWTPQAAPLGAPLLITGATGTLGRAPRPRLRASRPPLCADLPSRSWRSRSEDSVAQRAGRRAALGGDQRRRLGAGRRRRSRRRGLPHAPTPAGRPTWRRPAPRPACPSSASRPTWSSTASKGAPYTEDDAPNRRSTSTAVARPRRKRRCWRRAAGR